MEEMEIVHEDSNIILISPSPILGEITEKFWGKQHFASTLWHAFLL